MLGLTPLPASPARGEVPLRVWGGNPATASMSTLPLAGRVGEGVKSAGCFPSNRSSFPKRAQLIFPAMEMGLSDNRHSG